MVSKQGVFLLRSAMKRMTRSARRIPVLEEEIKTRSYELANWQREYRIAKHLLIEQMKEMGLLETATAGWEERAAAFFAELEEQES